MSKEYSETNIPYGGNLKKAMIARDRPAIRFIMARRKPVLNTEEKTCCIICLDTFNGGRRKRIDCPKCSKGCCEQCFRRHLLESSSTQPECANCVHNFSLEFVADVTPKNFHNVLYRQKRAKDRLSQERSLLPATQILLIDERERKQRDEQVWELTDEARYLRHRLNEIRKEIHELHRRVHAPDDSKKKERNVFIMGCPMSNCRGFLSQAWKCGTCGTHICSKCRTAKESQRDDNHICEKGDIATASLLAKETKSCPSCAVPIYKIAGCDQMWCTECKTPFSWRTGRMVTGVIHNPHFYQWQRNQNGGNAPRRGERYDCGGLPWVRTLRLIMKERSYQFKMWEDCHRSIGHVQQVIMPRYPQQVGIEDHGDLRLKFLLKDISEGQWLEHLQRRQKRTEKNQEVYNVLDMYTVTLTGIFQMFATNDNYDLAGEAHALREYVNKQLQGISHRYNNVVPYLAKKDWSVVFCR